MEQQNTTEVEQNKPLVEDYSKWEKGKDYPEDMDEVALATISKGYLLPGKHLEKHIEE